MSYVVEDFYHGKILKGEYSTKQEAEKEIDERIQLHKSKGESYDYNILEIKSK